MSQETEALNLQVPKLARQFALIYEYNGEKSSADPRSFTGSEKTRRENAILKQHPHTGYAETIRKSRSTAFFKPYTSWGDFLDGVTDPIIIPSYLTFKSLCHFISAAFSAIDCFVESCLALICKPFSNKLSSEFAQDAVDSFYKTRTSLISSLVSAIASVVSLINLSVLLLTKSISTLVCTVTEPEVVEDNTALKFPSL